MIGQTLDGRYEIAEEVGRGGIGVVYRARQISAQGRDVAVKVLLPSALSSHNAVTRFENEAAIIGTLRHPNTIRMFDTGRTADGRLYVVTEFLEGETLLARLERGPLSQLETVDTLIPIARSLDEAHRRGIVHRDLKLANIFLERVGEQDVVKVLDFGIAKLVDHERITAPMQIFGTPGFMSPEQCRGGAVSASSDIFALGILGFSMLTQRFPYDGADANALVVATLTKTPYTLSAVRPEVRWEPLLEALLDQLLAYDPTDRLPTAAAVAEAFENVHRALDHTAGVVLPGQLVAPQGAPRDARSGAESGEELVATLPLVAPPSRPAETSPPVGAPSPIEASELMSDPTPEDASGPTLVPLDFGPPTPETPLPDDVDDTKPPRSGARISPASSMRPDVDGVLRATVGPGDDGLVAFDASPLAVTPVMGGSDDSAGMLDTLPLIPDAAAATVQVPPPAKRPHVLRTTLLVLGVAAVLAACVALVVQLS
ncbi:MAG: protein kinase [Deltaproteobacteria bacterium]